MVYLLYVFIAITVVLIFLLFVPVGAEVIYSTEIKLFLKIGFIKIDSDKVKTSKRKPKEKASVPEKGKDKLPEAELKKLLALRKEISELAEFVAGKCIYIENTEFKLDFGCGDAAVTGILTGVVNSFVYSVVAVLHHKTTLKKWKVEINPDFDKTGFNLYFDCICMTRPVHIIRMGIKALKLYKKYKNCK